MKAQIDLVTGFLGSGKTTFINALLQDQAAGKERIVVIQREYGEQEIARELGEDMVIFIEKMEKGSTLDAGFLGEILKKYTPDRIIIEQNGMAKAGELLEELDNREISIRCRINNIVTTINAATFDILLRNLGSILAEKISRCNLIVLNGVEGLTEEALQATEKTLQACNGSARIVRQGKDGSIAWTGKAVKAKGGPANQSFRANLYRFLLLSAGFLLICTAGRSVDFLTLHFDFSRLRAVNTVFLSILIEAFPFLLFGVLVSSIIQVFFSEETMLKFFPKKKGLGFIVALLAGVFFPVCDCATIPVAARLVKKGVPLPIAVTFMLAAPLVNPVTIISTLYAFPGQPIVALYRVGVGMTVALAVGLAFLLFQRENTTVLTEVDDYPCSCGYCSDTTSGKGIWKKIEAVFSHAGSEFFDVGRYLITGALLSGIFQTLVPKDIFATGGIYGVSLIMMMLCAFVLSVCSTSDAFIARTFVNQFPLGAVLGFMVLGPMIDLKNLFMLMGRFRKSFVVKLVVIIFGLSFALLMFFSKVRL